MTKRIILAVSGSISAYKSADLTSKLKKKGYDIHVIMTEAAQAFIKAGATRIGTSSGVAIMKGQESHDSY